MFAVALGEGFLATTRREAAEILVVEGWIAGAGVAAAASEFRGGNYDYVVATGGMTSSSWGQRRWQYAQAAEHTLLKSGLTQDRILLAPAREVETQRTFESALAVSRTLSTMGLKPRAVNVFTLGPHARRTALVYRKVLGPTIKVGVIAWQRPELQSGPWWQSTERAENLITQTAGYLFELILNSGRRGGDEGEGELSASNEGGDGG